MITDRWKKFAILVPLAPYLVLVAVLLLAALAVTYYRWKSEIRRAVQSEFLNQQQAGEIAALRAGAATSEAQAAAREGRIQELAAEVAKKEAISRQLSANLEKLKAEATAEQARIAALPADQLGLELQKTIATAGILRFAQDDSEGARRVLEIITDRDACREQLGISEAQNKNCEARNSMFDVQRSELTSQVRELKQALDLEKRAFEKRDDLAKVQVKTVQGPWIHRVWNRVKFPVGIALGGLGGYGLGRAVAR